MPDEQYAFPLDELLAGLTELANEGNQQALTALTDLILQQGGHIPDDEMGRLARIEVAGGDALHRAVAQEMRRRGTWRRFRIRQLAALYGSGARWLAGIVLLALLLLAGVFGSIVGLKWLLTVLGF